MKILFVDGTAGYYPQRLEQKPTGGISTSLTLIPRYLAGRGLDVSVMSVFNEDLLYKGVRYLKHPTPRNDFDVVVFNRNMLSRGMVEHFKAAKKVWWLHDIVDFRYLEDDAYRFMDKVVSLSRYCTQTYSDFYGIDHSKFEEIGNAVDKSVFYPGTAPRNRNLYVCASAPVKGFYPLEQLFTNMRRINPKFELRMYVSQSLHDMEDTPTIKAGLERLKSIGVNVCAPVSQQELASVMREAWAFLMPNHYPEICSNLLLQAQACGLPVIASNIGSAAEFIKHERTGLLTKYAPHDMFAWWHDYCGLAVRLNMDTELHRDISENSVGMVDGWDEIGERWLDLLLDVAGQKQSWAYKWLAGVR